MNPDDPDTFTHRTVTLKSPTQRNYHLVDQLPSDYDYKKHPTLLCLHGFPDCWVGWKHQIRGWVKAGYRVLVPDLLGYGQTDKPDDPTEYSFKKLSRDLASILDQVVGRNSQAFVIGHDWGSHLAGRFTLWHPDRVLGVVHISIGYFPPVKSWSESLEAEVKNTIYEYQLYFAKEECIKELEGNLKNFFNYAFHTHVFSGPEGIPANFGEIVTNVPDIPNGRFLLNEKELKYIMAQNKNLRGPTNYYRTWRLRCEEEKHLNTYREETRVLFLRGGKDKTSEVGGELQHMEVIEYDDAAHWLMIEKKEEVTKDVLKWLNASRSKR